MDIIQDWATHFLNDNPFANNNAAANNPTTSTLLSLALSLFSRLTSTLTLLNRTLTPLLTNLTSQNPDLATIALLLIILVISLKLLNMLAQTFLWWFRAVKSVVFWGGLIVLGVWMWQRGPEGVVGDLQGWGEVWRGEYEYWKEREDVGRRVREGWGGGRQQQQRWF